MLRFLLWRMLGLVAALGGVALIAWFIDGGPGRLLRGHATDGRLHLSSRAVLGSLSGDARAIWGWAPVSGVAPLRAFVVLAAASGIAIAIVRGLQRRCRRYVRLVIEPYRGDRAEPEAVVGVFDTVQFLDSPGERRSGGDGDGDGADGRELAGVGAGVEDGELVF